VLFLLELQCCWQVDQAAIEPFSLTLQAHWIHCCSNWNRALSMGQLLGMIQERANDRRFFAANFASNSMGPE
jgi:hypothetical protein